jgi:hypothetical protein
VRGPGLLVRLPRVFSVLSPGASAALQMFTSRSGSSTWALFFSATPYAIFAKCRNPFPGSALASREEVAYGG